MILFWFYFSGLLNMIIRKIFIVTGDWSQSTWVPEQVDNYGSIGALIIINPFNPELWNEHFYHWNWTCPLLQIGVSVKNHNRMTNSVDPNATDHSSGFALFVVLFWVFTSTPIWIFFLTRFKDRFSDQIQRWKSPLQKLRDERDKTNNEEV